MSGFRKTVTLFDDYYEMMADKVRMESYRKAIFEVVKKGDVVVDLGAGLGILSFLSLKAGADKVYAIEKMDSINLARRVADINGFSDRIVFINDNSKNIELPEKADVLVSETLGSFAIEENTLEFTVDARDRFLKKGGRVIPEEFALWLVPVESGAAYRKMSLWNGIFGINYSPARNEMTRKLLVEDISGKNFLAEPKIYEEIDCRAVKEHSLENTVTFEITRGGTAHGLGGWFKVWLTPSVYFDTSPQSHATHWRQAFFPFKEPITVNENDEMAVNMRISQRIKAEDNALISYDVACIPGKSVAGRKVGRNDPCLCGSGRKYKKCCGM